MARCQVSPRMIFMVDYSHITGLGEAVLTKIYLNLEANPFLTISQGFQQREYRADSTGF